MRRDQDWGDGAFADLRKQLAAVLAWSRRRWRYVFAAVLALYLVGPALTTNCFDQVVLYSRTTGWLLVSVGTSGVSGLEFSNAKPCPRKVFP